MQGEWNIIKRVWEMRAPQENQKAIPLGFLWEYDLKQV